MMQSALQIRLALVTGLTLAAVAVAGTGSRQESVTSESPARGEIEEMIRDSGGTVSVAFRAQNGTQELLLNADARFEDPNALRIPVMITVYSAAYSQNIKLSDPVGSRTNSGPATQTIGETCQAMITQNGDPATNLLLERFTLPAIRAQIRALGAEGMEIAAAFPNSEKNHTTARAVLILLWKLATDRVISPDASKEMVGLLARSSLHAPPPAALPTPSAPPAGGSVLLHDAVIVYGAHSFVLVIQVQGLKDYATSAELVARISAALNKAM
jgi:beta-lactamase class A